MRQFPTEAMKLARRNLEEISGVKLLDDWKWEERAKCFYLHLSIDIGKEYPDIPKVTEWYVTCNRSYPYCDINVYPSAACSFSCTFQHQSCNGITVEGRLWKNGKLCVDFDDKSLGNNGRESEPFEAAERLYWYTKRAVLWLQSAATGTLVARGDYFELPDFPAKTYGISFAFHEDMISAMVWEDQTENHGIAKLCTLNTEGKERIKVIYKFCAINDKKTIYQPIWGNLIPTETEDALWILLPSVPVINNWQAPLCFEELANVCLQMGLDFYGTIREFASKVRDGKPHLVLIGFPIPERIGEKNCQISWQAFELPILSYKNYTNRSAVPSKGKQAQKYGALQGFRPNEKGWWENDKKNILRKETSLNWICSYNWSSEALKGRGKLPDILTRKKIAMVGVGSLGTAIAELLVRAGVIRIDCIDGDFVSAGNLCRHTLAMQDINSGKSEAVAKRLSSIDPLVKVSAMQNYMSIDEDGQLQPDMRHCDILIDTTGENQVLSVLSAEPWKREKIICSCSVGLGAKRLYINIQRTKRPCYQSYYKYIRPYLLADQKEWEDKSLPRDSIGCWHPLFPARSDDMWMAACVSVKALESFLLDKSKNEMTAIYEAGEKDGLFAGLHLSEVVYE